MERHIADKSSGMYAHVPVEDVDVPGPRLNEIRTSWSQRLLLDTWFPETLAIALSSSSLIALVAIVFVYKDRPPPILPYKITLNAVISILATASRSLLLYVVAASIGQLKWCWYQENRKLQDIQTFDDASRGPWGSINLLVSRQARPIASIGAVITILALAFDPFVQQILTYPTRMIESKSSTPSPLTRAATFNLDATSDTWMNAIELGIWSVPGQFDPQPSCPTGSCTWPPLRSIGWCSRCQDARPYAALSNCNITTLLGNSSNVNTTACTVDLGHGSTTDVYHGADVSTYFDISKLRLCPTYPDCPKPVFNVSAMTIHRSMTWMLDSVQSSWTYGQSETGGPFPNKTYLSVMNPVIALAHVSVDFRNALNYGEGLEITAAEECVVSLCEKQSQVSTVNGTTSSTHLDSNFGSMAYVNGSNIGTDSFDDSSSYVCWSSSSETLPGKLASCDVSNLTDDAFFCPKWVLPCSARNNDDTLLTYATTLSDRLTGNSTAYFCGYNPSTQLLDGPGCSGNNVTSHTSPATEYINSYSLEQALQGVAASLSNISLFDSNTAILVEGTALESQTYTRVQYLWLLLPCALEIGGIVVLLVAITLSHHKGVKLWKSSLLPILYHGPQLESRQAAPDNVSAMTKLAGGVDVRLVYSATAMKSTLKQI